MPIDANVSQYPYDTYGCVVRTIWNTGITLLPLAQTSNPVDPWNAPASPIVQLSSPTGFIIIEFGATRKVVWPVVPAPALTPSVTGIMLASAEIALFAPPLTADGQTKLFHVMGRYVYIPQTPIWLMKNIPVGKVPYDTDSSTANMFSAANFDTSLNPLNP